MTGAVRQRVGAGVAVLRDGAEVLLVRRGDNGLWDLPGGAVVVGEEVETAARREVMEETGLTLGPLRLLGVFSGERHRHTYPDGNVVARWPLAALPEGVGETTRAYFEALRDRERA